MVKGENMNIDMLVIRDFGLLLASIASIAYYTAKFVLAQELSKIADRFSEKIDKLVDEIKEDRARLYANSERVGKVEESVKSAHKRIDKLEGGA